MGRDFIEYEGTLEQVNDFDLWALRHFLLAETAAFEAAHPSVVASELRLFFEGWNWQGPGVFTGTDFSSFVRSSRERWELLFHVLQKTANRIEAFGELIPLSYLNSHTNTPMASWTVPQPTARFQKLIGRICKLLSGHEPQSGKDSI